MGTNGQVEIFEVGKEQLWRWCGHMGRCCVVEGRVVLNDRFSVMDGVSLAKGRYVLVCVCVRFGGQLGGWLVCDSFRSRRKAEAAYLGSVEHVEWSMTRYPRVVAYCEHFEVWHIVDDAELWGTWQALVDAEREERETLEALRQLREAGEPEPMAALGEPEPDDGDWPDCVACHDYVDFPSVCVSCPFWWIDDDSCPFWWADDDPRLLQLRSGGGLNED